MTICLIGDLQDLVCVYVGWLARQHGIDVLDLAEDTLGVTWSFAFDDMDSEHGCLTVGDVRHAFADISGAFVRLNPKPALPSGLALTPVQEHAFTIERRAGIQYLLDRLPFAIANRPSSGRSNGSKPYQMGLLRAAGFDVPRWIVSNEAQPITDFVQSCRSGAIYKACSGLRSTVRLVDDSLVERLEQGTSPVLAQEYIAGREVRIHTVGQAYFATEVKGEGIDSRPGGRSYQATSAPTAIAERCIQFAEREGQLIAGFDFRIADDGCWYCLEMNPAPTFLPYEVATGQPIGDTLLGLLAVN